jgi:glutaredoxin
VASYELYGTERCPYTKEMRDWLELRDAEFQEHDVENDPAARERLMRISGGQRVVPVLVAEGRVVQVGWQGRSCTINVEGKA